MLTKMKTNEMRALTGGLRAYPGARGSALSTPNRPPPPYPICVTADVAPKVGPIKVKIGGLGKAGFKEL